MPETPFFDQAAPGAGKTRTHAGQAGGHGRAGDRGVERDRRGHGDSARGRGGGGGGRGPAQGPAGRSSPRASATQGGTVLVLESDITDERQATDAVERTVAELGRLDTLVNNAGVMLLGPAVGAPLPEWQRMVDLNVMGLLYCAHAALPHLLRAAEDGPRRVADMVNISSMAGRIARNGSARLHPDQARHRRVQRGAAPGSDPAARARLARRARRDRDRAGRPQPARGTRSHAGPGHRHAADGAEDIADMIAYIVTRPRHVAVNEVLIRPTEQA